jgi:hypothetical protein
MSALPPRADIVQVIPVANSCERGHGSLAGLSVPARGSSAADLTTSYVPSHTPSLETDSVGKSHRGPGPFDSAVFGRERSGSAFGRDTLDATSSAHIGRVQPKLLGEAAFPGFMRPDHLTWRFSREFSEEAVTPVSDNSSQDDQGGANDHD